MKVNNRKRNLKIGIIGCGRMARVHLGYILQNIPNENITLCDLDEIRSKALAEEFQIKEYFSDLEKMFTQFKPHICHVLTPPLTHAQVTIQCMNHGCHVFIEKPMCTTLPEADKIISVSNRTKRLVCIGHQLLFEQRIIEAKRLITSGKLGRVIHISRVVNDDFLERSKLGFAPRWVSDLPSGMFFDLLPHSIYLLEYFMPGLDLKNAYYVCNHGHEVSDLYVNFTSTNGAGSLHISFSARLLQSYIRIECTEGWIYIDLRNFVTLIRKKRQIPDIIERVLGNLDISYQLLAKTLKSGFLFLLGKLKPYEGTGRLIYQFYDAIFQKGASPVPPERGKEVVRLCKKIISTTLNECDFSQKKEEFKQVFVKKSDAKILVTGGTGFIGRHLVSRLASDGQKIRVLSRCLNSLPPQFPHNVEVIRGDVCDRQVVDSVINGVETVYHLAATTKGDWLQHLDTTVRGTKNILDSMVENGVNKLVYVSSASVYDHTNYPNNGTIDEEFPYERNPYKRGYYSNAKLQAEKLVRQCMEDGKVNACIIRPGMVYGPGRPVLSVLLPHVTLKKILIFLGQPKKKLHLVYVENLVDALILVGKDEKANGCIFNVVDHDDATLSQYIESYKHLTKNSLCTIYIPISTLQSGFKVIEFITGLLLKKELNFSYKLKAVSKSGSANYSTEKIEKALGWKSRISFNQAFRETVDHLKKE